MQICGVIYQVVFDINFLVWCLILCINFFLSYIKFFIQDLCCFSFLLNIWIMVYLENGIFMDVSYLYDFMMLLECIRIIYILLYSD